MGGASYTHGVNSFLRDIQHVVDREKGRKNIFKEDGGEIKEIDAVLPGEIGKVKIKFEDGNTGNYLLTEYDATKGFLEFSTVPTSRTKFLENWNSKIKYTSDQKDNDAEASLNDENANDDTESTQHTLYHLENLNAFLVGENIPVHVSNLTGPSSANAFREIDENNVKEIKNLLKRGGKCYKILVGHIKGKSKEAIVTNDLRQPNSYKIETLGGNHTRVAIDELIQEDPKHRTTYQYVMCTVYAGLSDRDALKLGYEHNKCNEVGKATSTEDILRLFRRELLRALGQTDSDNVNDHEYITVSISRSVTAKWHEQLCYIFGLSKNDRQLHNQYKTHLAAVKCSHNVWKKLLSMFNLWNQGKFKRKPKGCLKTVHLKEFATLSDEKKMACLTILLDNKDWASFKEAVRNAKVQSEERNNKGNGKGNSKGSGKAKSTSASGEIGESTSDQSMGKKRKMSMKDDEAEMLERKNGILKRNLLVLRKRLKTQKDHLEKTHIDLRAKLEKSEKRCASLKSDLDATRIRNGKQIEEMKAKTAILEKEKSDLEESLQYYMLHALSETQTETREEVDSNNAKGNEIDKNGHDKVTVVEYNKKIYLAVFDALTCEIMYCKAPYGKINNDEFVNISNNNSFKLNKRDVQEMREDFHICDVNATIDNDVILQNSILEDDISYAQCRSKLPLPGGGQASCDLPHTHVAYVYSTPKGAVICCPCRRYRPWRRCRRNEVQKLYMGRRLCCQRWRFGPITDRDPGPRR